MFGHAIKAIAQQHAPERYSLWIVGVTSGTRDMAVRWSRICRFVSGCRAGMNAIQFFGTSVMMQYRMSSTAGGLLPRACAVAASKH